MKKFKLMQIVPSLRSGGVEQGTLDVANYLASLEIKNYVCSNGGDMIADLNKRYVGNFILPVHSKNFVKLPFVAMKINEILIKRKINILHFRSRAPAWLLPFLNVKNIKTVSSFHNVYSGDNFFKKIYNKQLGKSNNIIAISKFVKNSIIEKYNILEDKITVINRGVDTDFFDGKIKENENFNKFINKNKINLDKKIILFPGRLTNWKGQINFLKIAKHFSDKPIVFYFVGDDKNKSYLNKLRNEIMINNLNSTCKILGKFNKFELKMMYYCSDLVISAPLKPEGFGRIISETLSMKKIILSYNFGGAKDQLNELDDIYKIENQNQDAMISKINFLLQKNVNEVNHLGEIARFHVIKNFSKKIMLDSYFNFYQGL